MIYLPEAAYLPTPFYSKIKCEPTWKWPQRELPLSNYDLFYVWEGTGEVIVNGTSYSVGKGSCFLFKPGDYTSASHDKQHPLVLTYIHFNFLEQPNLIPSTYRQLSNLTEIETLLSRYVHARLSALFGSEVEANLILKQLMIQLLRYDQLELDVKPKTSLVLYDRILEIANYMREHSANWFSIEELANRAQLSPRYFSAKFKEIMGVNARDYEIRSRIERAEFLLHYGGLTVSETADALGYKDVYFFSKQFKKHFGKNPSAIR
ncbi:AraC family transcriptional regulator [Paenibacillus psychroresistens]|uniref:AraC family transcriptional regulator n=1 Tax=Paenibacillus psychroresistens TaxID=1778678 RepID=A0A6B8RMF3_9BACL|nr:AraC family transcriptional regulator [Paenibacillus psychroresistens]QGQ96715.1 AraC family transcriptional regulator [Paenibacillus psychroresistens]